MQNKFVKTVHNHPLYLLFIIQLTNHKIKETVKNQAEN